MQGDAVSEGSLNHPLMWGVNLLSDPIHGYIELTKKLSPEHARRLGLEEESSAEGDILDSAWLQRMRRISQLQSARWVFPTAEHSRFTHSLGVMHEAGLWARHLYPSLRATLEAVAPAAAPDVGRAVGRARRRDAAAGRPPPRRRTRAVRPFLRRARALPLPRARRPAPSRQEPDPRGPVAADHRARARRLDPLDPSGARRNPLARRPPSR